MSTAGDRLFPWDVPSSAAQGGAFPTNLDVSPSQISTKTDADQMQGSGAHSALLPSWMSSPSPTELSVVSNEYDDMDEYELSWLSHGDS